MAANYYNNHLGRFFRDHDFAMASLQALFEQKADGSYGLADPESGYERVAELASGMTNYPEKFKRAGGTIGSRPSSDPHSSRYLDTMIRPACGGEPIEIGEMQVVASDVAVRSRFWAQKPEQIVQDISEFLATPEA